VQVWHGAGQPWDSHAEIAKNHGKLAGDCDQPIGALLTDLKQRGLLEDTLVVWGGEFGRTVYCQDNLTAQQYGRDHHPRCFSVWMAGGGIQGGMSYGATDDYGYNIAENPVSVHDLHATILHQLGIDHEKLTYKFQGRYYRLTDIHGNVVRDILS
jgi:arylsulfatase A-like enzyme